MNAFPIHSRRLEIALLAAALFSPWLAIRANPVGGTVTQGSASISSHGSQVTIQSSGNALINWASFNIAAGETTTFVEPSATSVIWNKINDPNASQILGQIDANGYVVLQNQSGFYIGGQAVINAAGLIMTTTPTVPLDLTGGGAWNFSAPPPTAKIINYGQINAGNGGSVFLIAQDVENKGAINAPGGSIGLYAGQQVLVSERPDGRGLSAQVTLPEGSVDNTGKLIADAGAIAMNAQVVNQGGLAQANSVREVNGVIQLLAGNSLTLGAGSQISAKGDSEGVSAGGSVTLKSGGTFSDQPTSVVDVSGGAQGGNGGQVEISAPQIGAIHSRFNAGALSGWTAGEMFLDPVSILLVSDGSGTDASSGTVSVGDQSNPDSSGGLTLNVQSLAGFSQILLQASQDITLAGQWNLNDSSDAHATLTLEAGRNIIAEDGSYITAGMNWTVNLYAGVNFTTSPVSVISGTGTIDLTGSSTAAGNGTGTAYIQTENGALNAIAGKNIFVGSGNFQTDSGALNVTAGQNLTVGSGAIRTLNGGAITATATTGTVNTGTGTTGYDFGDDTSPGYHADPGLSGISTVAGGDVTITAGLDVVSLLPGTKNSQDAGSGAFGPEPGVVTITAGRNVTGHYVAADSVAGGELVASTITAGQDAGTSGKLLSLSLVTGGWEVDAPNGSIFLQEVHNPNGTLDSIAGTYKHVFDYDPDSFVTLNAADLVELAGSSLSRNGGDNVPVLYPPTLTIEAGAGGVALGNSVTLFPSPDGEMNITTTGGGSLDSLNGSTFNLVMSDSDRTTWTTGAFGTSDHASIPVQLDNPNPVVLDISGNIVDMSIFTPKETEITVGGDMDNSTFNGQNLHPGDVTTIDVGGQLFSRNQTTFELLGSALPADVAAELNNPAFFSLLYDANGNAISFDSGQTTFSYTPGSTSIGYTGRMEAGTLQALLAGGLQTPVMIGGKPEQELVNGQPVFDSSGNPVYVLMSAPFLNAATLNYLFSNSQDVPATESAGYHISGPGNFDINAGTIDLGSSSPGIISFGPAANRALTGLGSGANINIDVVGNLTMFSSTIATYLGGDINIYAGGTINVGSAQDFGANSISRGIYTVGPGNIDVTAVGTVDVAGSRIGTFDGGNITIESLTGDVNAGSGTQSSIFLTLYQVDPVTGLIDQLQQTFPGSGIQTLTLPQTVSGNGVTITEPATDQPGNISITTPRGNIFASLGGIIQEPLNGNGAPGPTVNLSAGTSDANGNVIYVGNIDLGQSGVIGGAVTVNATGSVSGLVIGRQDTTVTAVDSFNGTVLSGGIASVNAGGSVGGTIIGLGGVSVGGGGNVTANLVSQNVSVGGASVGSTLGTATASATTTAAAGALADTDQPDKIAAAAQDDDELNKRKHPLLAKLVGRVTVILPK